MDLGDRAVLPIAQLTDHCDDIQAKFPVGECPGSFFFCSIGQMIQLTLRVATAPHHQGEADQPPERHQCALGVVRHPQPFSTVHALFGERDQSDFSLCRGTGFSSSHVLAPPSGNSSVTFLRKKFRSSLSVERTSSTVSGGTRPVAPIHLKNFLNEARYTFMLVTEAHKALRGNQSSKKS